MNPSKFSTRIEHEVAELRQAVESLPELRGTEEQDRVAMVKAFSHRRHCLVYTVHMKGQARKTFNKYYKSGSISAGKPEKRASNFSRKIGSLVRNRTLNREEKADKGRKFNEKVDKYVEELENLVQLCEKLGLKILKDLKLDADMYNFESESELVQEGKDDAHDFKVLLQRAAKATADNRSALEFLLREQMIWLKA